MSTRPILPRELDPEMRTLEDPDAGSKKSIGLIKKTV